MKHTPLIRAAEITAGVPRMPGSKFEKTDSPMLWLDVLQGIFELAARATQKEKDSAEFLFSVTREAVIELRAMVEEAPDMLGDALKKSPQFPLMTSLHPENEKANNQFLKRHRIGESAQINAHLGSRWTRTDAATVLANDIIETLRSNQKKMQLLEAMPPKAKRILLTKPFPEWAKKCGTLPTLSKDTAAQWWALGKLALLERYPQPEKILELRDISRKGSPSKMRSRMLFLVGRAIRSMASK